MKCDKFATHGHLLIKGSIAVTLDKPTWTEICSILISEVRNKIFSKIYIESMILSLQQFIYYLAVYDTCIWFCNIKP